MATQGRDERGEERQGEEVRVEEVFAPVGAVGRVCGLDVEAHDRGEDLREEEDEEAGYEASCVGGGGGGCFALI